MFGTNEQFNLERLPFSVYGAFLSVYQDVNDKKMYLSICRGFQPLLERPSLMELDVFKNGESVDFTYSCSPSKLTFTADDGTVEFTYEHDPSVMRIRATGVTLRIRYTPKMHEGGCRLANGDIELGFNRTGKIKLVCISGEMKADLQWNYLTVSPYPFDVELIPGAEPAEMAIHEYVSTCPRWDSYAEFDMAAKQKEKEFEEFSENYTKVPAAYEAMADKAKYMVWHSYLGPRGFLKSPVVYMHKLYMNRAFGWQQAFHAMAMRNNAGEAWRLLLSFFDYQNEIGGLPDHISDTGQATYITTKPPIQGYAVLYILNGFPCAELSEDDYRSMYDKLSAYTKWWFIHHDHIGTGYPSYYHPDESGYDESSTFDEGLPIVSPDLLSYMVFNCEACARLAGLLGNGSEAEYWKQEGKRLLDYMINVLWDGEQFEAYLPGKKLLYKCGSITQLLPIMLGKRLPDTIAARLVSRLTDPGQFSTDCGFSTENLQSEKVVMRMFTRGATVAPTQFFLLNGMNDAGYCKEAAAECAKYLNALLYKGLALGIHSFRVEPILKQTITAESTGMSVGYPFSSWVGSVFLALAETIAR
ncbi:MAG: hypothetical protein IKH56_00405 [Oscillospiraceae bacterium]|nr:hypothetical protein [Oscillospiraceae bacterium]